MRRAAIALGVALTLLASAPARADGSAAEPAAVLTVDGAEASVHFFDDRARDTFSDFVTVALTNAGDVPVANLTSTLAGARAEDFEMLADGCDGETLMLAGDRCEILLRYHPRAAGISDADLTLDYTGGSRALMLSGMAREPAPRFAIDRTSVTFAPLALGYGTGASLEITNTGFGNLTVGSITMSDPAAEHFFVDAANRCRDSIVREGERCRVGISFVPTAQGRFEGTIEIHHDAPGSPARIAVTGEAVMVHPAVSDGDFASLLDGDSTSRVITIRNTYYRDMTLDALAIAGDTDSFAVTTDDCSGRLLKRDEACTAEITFAPHAPGAKEAILLVPTDAPGGTKEVALSGRSIARVERLRPSRPSVKMGTLRAGKGRRARIVFTSDGTIPTTIRGVRRVGSSWFRVVRDRCSRRTLAPGERCDIVVLFRAKASGLRRAALSVRTTGGTRTLRMAGRGRPRR